MDLNNYIYIVNKVSVTGHWTFSHISGNSPEGQLMLCWCVCVCFYHMVGTVVCRHRLGNKTFARTKVLIPWISTTLPVHQDPYVFMIAACGTVADNIWRERRRTGRDKKRDTRKDGNRLWHTRLLDTVENENVSHCSPQSCCWKLCRLLLISAESCKWTALFGQSWGNGAR